MKTVLLRVLSFFSAFLMLFSEPGRSIRQLIISRKCTDFIGESAEVNALGAVEGFSHPFLAPEGTNGMHVNSYNTGAYTYSGPLGKDPVVKSKAMNVFGGLVATLMFDSKGRIMCISGNVVGFRLLLMDADTLEILAETRLPQRASSRAFFRTLDFDNVSSDTSGGAYCHLLMGDRPLIANADNVIQIYYVDETSGKPEWKVEKEWDLRGSLPRGSYITDAVPDYDGNIWFVTRPGQVGYVEPRSGVAHTITLKNEEIQNTLAICADGVYIVSDHAMYRFEIGSDKLPAFTW